MTPKEVRQEVQKVIEYFNPNNKPINLGGASNFCKPKKRLTEDIRGRGVGDIPYCDWESRNPGGSKK